MWLIPTDAPGLTITPLDEIGWHSEPSCEVFIDEVRLPRTCLLGELNAGWRQLMKNFGMERACISALSVGMAQAALDDAATYANQRVQFGQPIGTFQLVQKRIGDMAMKIELARNLAYKTAWLFDQGQDVRVEAAMTKLYSSVMCQEVCDDAIQVHGGLGVLNDRRVSRLWRNSRLQRLGGGTDEMMYRAIAPAVLRKYA